MQRLKQEKLESVLILYSSFSWPSWTPLFTGQTYWERKQKYRMNKFTEHFAPKKQTTRSVQEKSSHCQYNENGLWDIDVTWQPRGVDWNVNV